MDEDLCKNLIDKCQITISKHISEDKELLKQITSIGFKIIAFEPVVIECDSFPAEHQVSKLFDVLSIKYNPIQKTKFDKLTVPVEKGELSTRQCNLEDCNIEASNDSPSSDSNVESDNEEYDSQQDENEATSSTSNVSSKNYQSPIIKQFSEISKENTGKIAIKQSNLNELEESFENLSLNKTKNINQKASENVDPHDSLTIKLKSPSSNNSDPDNEKIELNSFHFQGTDKFQSETFLQKQLENAITDEDNFDVQEGHNFSLGCDFEKVSKAEVFASTKKPTPEDFSSNASILDDAADDFKDDVKEQSHPSEQELPKLFQAGSNEKHDTTSLLRNAGFERAEANSLVSETEVQEMSLKQPYRKQDNVTSDKENSDYDSGSDEDGTTFFQIKKDVFEAVKFYYEGSPFLSLLNIVEDLDTSYELEIVLKSNEAKDFLLKIKDFRKIEVEIIENMDTILSNLKRCHVDIKTLFRSKTTLVIMGPSADVRAAHTKVKSLIENRNDEAFQSSKFEGHHSKKSEDMKHLEETGKIKIKDGSDHQQIQSRDSSILKMKSSPETAGLNFNVTSQHGGARAKDSSRNLSERLKEDQPTQYAASQAYCKRSPDENREQRHSNELKTGEAVYIGSSGIKVYVYSANITDLQVDCVVNAANSYLKCTGGISAVIAKASGPSLIEECTEFINEGNVVVVTDVFVSGAGNLNAGKVIHAVGPCWEDYQSHEKQKCVVDLKRVVLRSLIEASLLKMRSIAVPSISSAIFHVPQQYCAESYVNAVKSFNLIAKEFSLFSLKYIHFVDINTQMVSTITNFFLQNKDKDITSSVLKEDLAFARKHLERNKEERNIGIMESLFASPRVYNSESDVRENNQGKRYRKVEEHKDYQIGELHLRVSTRNALDFNTDLVITVGKPFDYLSGNTQFIIRKSRLTSEEKKVDFLLCEREYKPPIFLCELAVSAQSDEKFAAALKKLNSAISCYPNLVQSLVVTSKFLYPEKSFLSVKEPDKKFITIFSQLVYNFIKKATTDSFIKNVIITTSEEAFSAIIQVLDALEDSRGADSGGSSVDNVCSFCRRSVGNLQIFHCCKKNLCIDCTPEHRKCHATQQGFIATGNQPDGEMMLMHRPDLPVPGTSAMGVFLIEYIFPDGVQNSSHPDPRKPYRGCNFVAFLPATQEGFYALQLLRVAFLRRLTFTIGMAHGNNYTISWNGVHLYLYNNKYTYIDPKYPLNVIAELKAKGVTMDNLTQEELDDWERLKQQMSSPSNVK